MINHGKRPGRCCQGCIHQWAGKAHQVLLEISPSPAPGQTGTQLVVVDFHAYLFQDLQAGLVNTFHLMVSEDGEAIVHGDR
jgi:hypothetical protein